MGALTLVSLVIRLHQLHCMLHMLNPCYDSILIVRAFNPSHPRQCRPAAREVEALTLESLAVRLGSLHYLLDMLGPIGDSVHKRWIEEQEQHAQRRTSGANSSTSGHGSSGGGISSGGGWSTGNGTSGMRAGNGHGGRANGAGVDHRAMFEAMLQGAEQVRN